MRKHRIHLPQPLSLDAIVELSAERSHYLSRVLRLSVGDPVSVFDGAGREYQGRIELLTRNGGRIRLTESLQTVPESPLAITLVQSISRGDRMDSTLQKATELGVHTICPIFSERNEVRLSGERLEKRMSHWRGVVAAACEQCQRATVPEVLEPLDFTDALAMASDRLALVLDPASSDRLADLARQPEVVLAVGPEGGFSEMELAAFGAAGWQGVALGPRVLRTETAGPAAIAILQVLCGDI